MSDQSNTLNRTLSTGDLVIFGMIFIVPIAPFAWYGTYLETAQGMVALGYLIALVAMLFTGFSYAKMSREYPVSGSVYNYVQHATTSDLGFISGWTILLDYFFCLTIFECVGTMFFQAIVPAAPTWLCMIVLAIGCLVVNLLGIKTSTKVSWGLFFLQIVLCVVFIVCSVLYISKGHAHFNTVAFVNPDGFSMHGVLRATMIVVVSYLGFDAISTLAEESSNPKKQIGKATILCIIVIGLLFVLLTWLDGCVYPNWHELTADTASLDICRAIGGQPLVLFASICLVLSFGIAGTMEAMTSTSRILYSMGRDGIMPKWMAKLNKHKVPGNTLVVITIIATALGIILGLGPVANLASFGALFGFMALNLAVVWRFFIKDSEKTGGKFIKYVISPIIGFIVCLMIFISMDKLTAIIGFSWMAGGFLWMAYKTHGFKEPAPTINMDDIVIDE
jgi:Amino acid transporters